jgi:hypothetical protein
MSFKEWLVFLLIALAGLGLWLRLAYPQFSFVDLSVDKTAALTKAKEYLALRGVDTVSYRKAVVFNSDDWTDRYLQKTVGFAKEGDFIKEHDYELFYWRVRLFKEFQKEEYLVDISPKTGRVISFAHLIEDITLRSTPEKEQAKGRAEDFLKRYLGINLSDYDFHEEKATRYEQRTDYSFSWEKKGVYIPWKKDQGGAKLLVGATISGDEVRKFFAPQLDIPEKFQRFIENQLSFGQYIYSFHFLIFVFLLISSIAIVVKRRSSAVSRFSKKWFFCLAAFIAAANIIFVLDNLQSKIIDYPTSVSWVSYLGIYFANTLISMVLFSAAIIFPGLAGEGLRSEVFPGKRESGFSHYLRSSFLSRQVSAAILLGYLIFFIMLGLQAGLFYLGQRYLGVWKEWINLAQFSSAGIPFLSALCLGVSASLNEEVLFRVFGISWGKKYLKNTCLAVVFSALIWGFGHTAYPVFPVWFRGIEVSIIGLLYGFIFLRYGLLPLIAAHYLFDVFWGLAAYILKPSSVYLFGGSALVLALPFLFAGLTFFMNRQEKERPLAAILDETQQYNLGILIAYVTAKKSQGLLAQDISRELTSHNWDRDLVEIAVGQVFKTGGA